MPGDPSLANASALGHTRRDAVAALMVATRTGG